MMHDIIDVLTRARSLRASITYQVEKNSATTRSHNEPDKLSLVFKLRCRVPEQSYLFIGSGTYMPITRDINRVLKKLSGRLQACKSFDELLRDETIARLVSQIRLVQTPVTYYVQGRRDLVVIPGSSIKGAIRARLEYAFKPVDNKVKSCYIKQTTHEPDWQKGWRHIYIYGPEVAVYRVSTCDYTHDRQVCKVCDIMGTAGLASRVDFSDAIPVRDFELVELTLEYGEHIFAIPPGAEFELEIAMRNMSPSEIGLVLMAMNLHLQELRPILIGRFKYKAKTEKTTGRKLIFGQLVFDRNSATIYMPRFVLRTGIRELLRSLGIPVSDSNLELPKREQDRDYVMKLLNFFVKCAQEEFGSFLREEFIKGDDVVLKRLEKVREHEFHI